ncbi:Predicted metalloprotease, contains C-terminal PDZ domain [Marivirga sericea]|uniref:Predicted metalloprotease, contains C-terminal PDZ domain n=1 Tax=Marivirga sericea TaxID=1028 RepID=A0A1X7LHI8_9BACT|nr:M61 family metallopeptidase [Marivirga sericea]SMG52732.1 Predicted metalloprotease, contains C-terminal PDZ domain [Marivirga sericea]
MIQYTLSQKYPQDSFLQVEVLVKPSQANFEMKLPDWRPGRYQLGNFSKYLRNFRATNPKKERLDYKKTNKNTWQIHCKDEYCVIQYEIFTSTIDGGSTYVDEEHWYLNFINCLLYQPDAMLLNHKVQLEIPEDWTVACGLKKEGRNLFASSFYELVDSPVLSSSDLQHLQYKVQEIDFHLWFRGKADLRKREQIIEDFKKFTTFQMDTMGEFENQDYHFLFQIPDEKAYHGVEHLNSTCIVLGPAKEFNTASFYDNFLGISSHELFHYWNIIRIRPKELYPYDFEKENYFSTGYVAEGVTTYYGDLFLIRSGVKNLEWYLNELNILFKRHFENYGRFNSSLADSSWDLWLDGYEAGIPDRKVSIYVKGALIALILDLKIILETEGEKSLDNVMRKLWDNYYRQDKGFSPEDYLSTAEAVIGHDLTAYSKQFINGCHPIEEELSLLLGQFGFELHLKENEDSFAKHLGLKTNEGKVIGLAPDSPAEKQFRIGDQLISCENHRFNEIDTGNFVNSDKPTYSFHIFRNDVQKEIKLHSGKRLFYSRFTIKEKKSADNKENQMKKKWLNL